ncbi:MAG: hypothetical protein ACLP07_03105 [Terracidiphilus sp.]
MNTENQKTEEEIVELVADALTAIGFSASSQNTGGGICCVVLERKDGGEIIWGTADFNWGASVVDSDGEIESSIDTSCPSGSQDIAAIVEAIRGASATAGAATTGTV